MQIFNVRKNDLTHLNFANIAKAIAQVHPNLHFRIY